MYHKHIKEKSRILRMKGLSLDEISKKMGISKSTLSEWGIARETMKSVAKKRLEMRKKIGRSKGIEKSKLIRQVLHEQIKREIEKKSYTEAQIYCVLLWECEGSKERHVIKFTNSNPQLMRLFMKTFREGFQIRENKLRVIVHVHSYHDEEKQKKFWSGVTRVPISQFHKSYKKENSGKRKRVDYDGCATVKYYDSLLVVRMRAIYNLFCKNIGA